MEDLTKNIQNSIFYISDNINQHFEITKDLSI